MIDIFIICVIVWTISSLAVFSYFCFYFLPGLINPEQAQKLELERKAKKIEKKKGKVYNPSQDLDRTMRKGKPKIFD
jgi:hypothetical protein